MNKKRMLIVTIVIVLTLLLVGCGEGKPQNISEGHYKLGLKILEETDKYLDFEKDADKVYEALESLKTELDNLPAYSTDDPNRTKNNGVEVGLTLIKSQLMFAKHNEGDYDKLLKARNELAELLNEKKR